MFAKKRAKRAMDTGDMCQRRRVPSKPGAVSLPAKKESASDTRRLFFFVLRKTAPGFERTRRRRHMPPVPTARLARRAKTALDKCAEKRHYFSNT